MIGLLRPIVQVTAAILAPLLARDPEVYESRAVQRWAKRYVSFMLLAKQETDYERKVQMVARAMAARSALRHLSVEQKILDELDLAIHLTVSKGEHGTPD